MMPLIIYYSASESYRNQLKNSTYLSFPFAASSKYEGNYSTDEKGRSHIVYPGIKDFIISLAAYLTIPKMYPVMSQFCQF